MSERPVQSVTPAQALFEAAYRLGMALRAFGVDDRVEVRLPADVHTRTIANALADQLLYAIKIDGAPNRIEDPGEATSYFTLYGIRFGARKP